jgi:hypothetical protein
MSSPQHLNKRSASARDHSHALALASTLYELCITPLYLNAAVAPHCSPRRLRLQCMPAPARGRWHSAQARHAASCACCCTHARRGGELAGPERKHAAHASGV